MNAKTTQWSGRHEGPAVGLTIVGLTGLVSAGLAVAFIWALLHAPAEVTTAAAQGVPELLQVVLTAVYDAVRPLLAWI
jgi:hypothetical protein